MVRARKSAFASHLKNSYMKDLKQKHEHELQDAILKMSNHQLNFVDEVVNKSSEGKQLHSDFFPQIDVSDYKDIATKLKGHTHSQIALARRHRELKGSGFNIAGLVNGSKKALIAAGKAALKSGKFIGKVGVSAAKKTGQWMVANPQAAMQIGQTAVAVASQFMDDDDPVQQQQQQHRKPKRSQVETSALDQLLDTSDDEKAPQKKKASGLAPKKVRQHSRWII